MRTVRAGGPVTDYECCTSVGKETACGYSIASELGCDIGIDMFWASRTTVVYCGMKAIWPAMIGVVGIFRFASKEFMTM